MVILLLSLAIFEVNAQVQFGITSGINISSQVSNVNGWDHSLKSTPAVGLTFELGLARSSYLVIKGIYAGRGSITEDSRYNDLVYDFQQNYLEFPVLFRYKAGRTLKPFIQAGPVLGLLMNSKLGGHYGPNSLYADTRRINSDIDLGISFGAGLEYDLGLVRMNFQASYNLGLLNMLQPGAIEIQVGDDITSRGTISALDVSKSKGLQLMLGLTVPISSK